MTIISDLKNKSVAVIGNAQYLFDRNYGKEIDKHDIVIRMNRAAILTSHYYNYHTHGSKTNLWAVWRYDEYENMNTIRSVPQPIQMAFWYGSKNKNVIMYDINMLFSLINKLDHDHPTTGLMVLDMLSYNKVRNVSVYGFDWKETPTFTDLERKHDNNISHNFPKEKKLCEMYFSKELGYSFRF